MGPEATLQIKCLNRLKLMTGVWWVKIVGSPLQKKGTPDLLICKDGKLIAVEFKATGGKLTALQAIEMRKIRLAGGTCEVVRTVEEFEELVGYVR